MTVGNKKIAVQMTICKSMKSSQMDSLTLENISTRKDFIWVSRHQLVISLAMALLVHLDMNPLMQQILLHGVFITLNTTAVEAIMAKPILIDIL